MALTDLHLLATGFGKREKGSLPRLTRLFATTFAVLLLAESLPAVVTLKVGSSGGVVPFPHSNGRQIGMNREGLWFVAYDGRSSGGRTIFLAVSKSADPEFAGDFHPPVPLAGGSPENRIAGAAGGASAVSFVLDGDDVLHLIWQGTGPDAIWYSRCDVSGADASGKIRDSGNWAPAQRVDDSATDPRIGDLAVDATGRLWIAYSQAASSMDGYSRVQDGGTVYNRHNGRKETEEIWMATPSDRGWTRRVLTLPGAFRAPVMDLDPSGTLHLAFSRDDSWLLYYLQIPDLALSFDSGQDLTRILPHGPWSGTGFVNYSVVGWGKQALVVFEKSEHIILYAYFDGRNWTRKPLHYGRDKFHRPQLARDEHGVAWVFWSNSTRSHTFYSRWLGNGFSAPYESRTLAGDPLLHREATNIHTNELSAGPALSDFHTVQKEMPAGSGSLGMSLAATGSTGSGVFFDRMAVPDLKVEAGRKMLFLDMLEVSATDGLVENLHPMKKHPANPVLRTGPPGSFDDLRAHAYGEILYDEGRFRMWYSGLSQDYVTNQRSPHHVGYAESRDGVKWVKPNLNQVEYKGSKANNIMDMGGEGNSAYMPMVIKDDRETNPERRYKAIVATRGNPLLYSSDGIHWTRGGSVRMSFGDRRNFFYDTLETKPERRWKVYSHCARETYRWVRMTCVYWSADLLEWTSDPRNPNMFPRAGLEAEQHLTSVWLDGGMYPGMFDIWGPDHRMPQQLIVSRDGLNFVHVFDGKPVIELGRDGEWDAGWVSPVNVPLEVDGEFRIYYSGSATTIGWFHDWIHTPMHTGLATIRRDGFVSLDVAEGSESGSWTTIPLKPRGAPLELELNATGLDRGRGRILVELLRGDRIVARSNAVTGDGIATPVTWPYGGKQLGLPTGGDPLRLRFHLEGRARLYSFSFR